MSAPMKFLKSQLNTKWAIGNDCKAEFWEISSGALMVACCIIVAAEIGHCEMSVLCGSMLQCVPLQYAAVCCSVLQCTTACCHMVQGVHCGIEGVVKWVCCVAVCCSVLQRVAACCSVLQNCVGYCIVTERVVKLACCVAVRCSVLQCAAVCCSVLQNGAGYCIVALDDEIVVKCVLCHGLATISRLLTIIGLFCKRALIKETIFCKRDL